MSLEPRPRTNNFHSVEEAILDMRKKRAVALSHNSYSDMTPSAYSSIVGSGYSVSREDLQDLQAIHGVNANNELMRMQALVTTLAIVSLFMR